MLSANKVGVEKLGQSAVSTRAVAGRPHFIPRQRAGAADLLADLIGLEPTELKHPEGACIADGCGGCSRRSLAHLSPNDRNIDAKTIAKYVRICRLSR